ncbi:MAG: thiamine pyrophosphate-binding protein [Actinobacteria bacterium]|nr:thiamine pyrophosphate-binding protein [Actinomycetota bacterium]
MKKYSACQYIVDYMIKSRIPYVCGIIGHGNLPFADALFERQDEIGFIQVKHEQAATHIADGYCRATGNPLACITSVGPGAVNTLIGLGTAYHDSIPLAVFTSNCPTYIFQKGALQEIEMNSFTSFGNMANPVTKRTYQVTNIRQLPGTLETAFRLMTSGRPGPVAIELPMDIQAETVPGEPMNPKKYNFSSRILGDIDVIDSAVEMMLKAKRPVFLIGGGVILSDASRELIEISEYLGIPVVTTAQGKGAIPQDHELNAYYTGTFGSIPGLELTRKADLIIAVGCKFTEWTAQSFVPGKSFNFPETKLIQIDIDMREIGKNYPVDAGIMGDAKTCMKVMLEKIKIKNNKRDYKNSAYFKELTDLKDKWQERLKAARQSSIMPMRYSRFFAELRRALKRDAIVLGPAGHAQVILFQEFDVYYPRTHLTTGSWSTMGWCLPATIGAKLGRPDKQVIGICGDGDFLMTCQELATAVQYNIPAIYFVLNNFGWISIRDLQIAHFGKERKYGTTFMDFKDGGFYNPDFVKLAESFGAFGMKVDSIDSIGDALKAAQKSGKTSVIEVPIANEASESGGTYLGYSDMPRPDYIKDVKSK